MTSEEQLALWVAGTPVHNDDVWQEEVDETGKVLRRYKLEGGECCPDFSCCRPELLQPPEVRRAFAVADERGRNKFLLVFLRGLLTDSPVKVHLAGMGEADD